jgi:hypothetical protein
MLTMNVTYNCADVAPAPKVTIVFNNPRAHQMFRKSVLAVVLTCTTLSGVAGSASSEPASDDPMAAFTKLAAYISANPLDFETSFSSRSAILDTEFLNGKARIIAAQPNLLRLDTTSSKGSFLVISDGTTLTILDRSSNKYAQTSAKPSLGATVNLFTGLIVVEPQTLLFLDAVQAVATGQATAQASASGTEAVGGRTCKRYTVAGSDGATWEAWLEAKEIPLPCKLVSRDSDDPDATVQTNEFTWAQNTSHSTDTFTFTVPPASKQVDFGDLGLPD